MAKPPDRPRAPDKPMRHPARHSKKDPASPTRARGARSELEPVEPALADLLNPGIGQGTAGPGSQTGLKPPPDNSFDRRADFAAAHRARKSTTQELRESAQTRYAGEDLSANALEVELAQALGFEREEPDGDLDRKRMTHFRGTTGAAATVQALEQLLRE